jgi:serine/threonine protein phosphatase 1
MSSWLGSLFSGHKEKGSHISRLTYAIGDIHGRDDLFGRLLARIRDDARADSERPRLVLLGDYVDRGAQSKDVLERIRGLQREDWCDLVVLMGNHEEALLKFLQEPDYGPAWCDYGGAATLASYGVTPPQMRTDLSAWQRARDQFKDAIAPHLDMIQSMQLVLVEDDYLFVHAGVQPGKPLIEQGPDTFLWIRAAFLTSDKACDYVVVHGHTPQSDPSDTRWRIGVDTGAYATGVLTAVRLRGQERRFLTA